MIDYANGALFIVRGLEEGARARARAYFHRRRISRGRSLGSGACARRCLILSRWPHRNYPSWKLPNLSNLKCAEGTLPPTNVEESETFTPRYRLGKRTPRAGVRINCRVCNPRYISVNHITYFYV